MLCYQQASWCLCSRIGLFVSNDLLDLQKNIFQPYLHESRHLHALKRARGCGGRFLNSKKNENQQDEVASADNSQSNINLNSDRNDLAPSDKTSWKKFKEMMMLWTARIYACHERNHQPTATSDICLLMFHSGFVQPHVYRYRFCVVGVMLGEVARQSKYNIKWSDLFYQTNVISYVVFCRWDDRWD